MFRALFDWMDRNWESRRYNPVFAFAQRLIWGVPLFLSLALLAMLDAFGLSGESPATLTIFVVGAVGMFTVMLVSLYRWALGYSRTEFQEGAAMKHQARVAAWRNLLRKWFRSSGS